MMEFGLIMVNVIIKNISSSNKISIIDNVMNCGDTSLCPLRHQFPRYTIKSEFINLYF